VLFRSNDDEQYIWESTSENDFTITKDPNGDSLGRGTRIVMYVKEDSLEYLDQKVLTDLIHKYSEFINFPIYLWAEKTVTEEVDDDTPAEVSEEKKESEVEDVEDVTEAEGEKEKEPKKKTISKTVTEWAIMNENKPIWTRSADELEESDYHAFHRAFTKDTSDPLTYIHFKAEGDVEFKSILTIPKKPLDKFMDLGESEIKNIKLFVKRVFITDQLEGFVPRYLRFVRGLVDSDDLPLSVSRETLQQVNKNTMNIMKKRVTGKILEMIKVLAKDTEKYATFWAEYSTALKVGLIEDRKNTKKLQKLLRFVTSTDEKTLTSFDDYISRMKKGQKQIYCMTGELSSIANSPLVEKVIARGYEVVYMVEPIDEYLFQVDFKFGDGIKLQHVGKAGLLFGDEDDNLKEIMKEKETKFKPLTDFLKETLTAYVGTVKLSSQLTTSSCAILAESHGITGAMERIMSSQALASKDDYMLNYYKSLKKTLEINPEHPIMISMLKRVESGETDSLKDLTYVLFESAAISSDWSIRNPVEFAKKVEEIVRKNLDIDFNAQAKVEIVPAPEADPESKKVVPDSETSDESEEADEVPEPPFAMPEMPASDEGSHDEL